jgi:hypothetical protein
LLRASHRKPLTFSIGNGKVWLTFWGNNDTNIRVLNICRFSFSAGLFLENDRSPRALQAGRSFWSTFNVGRYADIDQVLEVHKAAYIENPRDAILATRIGSLHAPTSPTYGQWPFRKILEQRIALVDQNASLAVSQTSGVSDVALNLFRSSYSCMVCHQK